jgi:hypothetical protein
MKKCSICKKNKSEFVIFVEIHEVELAICSDCYLGSDRHGCGRDYLAEALLDVRKGIDLREDKGDTYAVYLCFPEEKKK